ncbi:unnamed protein product [Prunus armeniaca]
MSNGKQGSSWILGGNLGRVMSTCYQSIRFNFLWIPHLVCILSIVICSVFYSEMMLFDVDDLIRCFRKVCDELAENGQFTSKLKQEVVVSLTRGR